MSSTASYARNSGDTSDDQGSVALSQARIKNRLWSTVSHWLESAREYQRMLDAGSSPSIERVYQNCTALDALLSRVRRGRDSQRSARLDSDSHRRLTPWPGPYQSAENNPVACAVEVSDRGHQRRQCELTLIYNGQKSPDSMHIGVALLSAGNSRLSLVQPRRRVPSR